MPRFSANLGHLWTDLPLPEAIHAAAAAGFDAVELQFPYHLPAATLAAAARDAGLPILGLNTERGDVAAGDFGLAAQPGRGAQARAAVDQALDTAVALGADSVHVMAGKGSGPAHHAAFLDTLSYACAQAAPHAITILIEAINPHDVPGYFLRDTAHAAAILHEVGAPNLKLMFDCYHVGRVEGDVPARLAACLPITGHIQFAGVPDRGWPDKGTLDYGAVFAQIDRAGWTRPLGAEYRPGGPTEDSLGWMARWRG